MNDTSRGIKTYMVYGIYDSMNVQSFHQYLMDSVDILTYWNHLPLLYFVKSRCGFVDLTARIRPFFGGSWFIVNEIVPGAGDGLLPTQAWQWFITPAPDFKAPRPGSQTLLGALMSKPIT